MTTAAGMAFVDHHHFVVRGDVLLVQEYRNARRGEFRNDGVLDQLGLLRIRDHLHVHTARTRLDQRAGDIPVCEAERLHQNSVFCRPQRVDDDPGRVVAGGEGDLRRHHLFDFRRRLQRGCVRGEPQSKRQREPA